MDEQAYEKILNIKTTGEQKIFNKDHHYNRYEATSYNVLTTLLHNYKFKPTDTIDLCDYRIHHNFYWKCFAMRGI